MLELEAFSYNEIVETKAEKKNEKDFLASL